MSQRRTVVRRGPGNNAANGEPRPLALAISALLEGVPHQPIELAPGIFVRAETIVRALAPEILERIDALLAPQSISADAIERIREYTGRAA